MFAPLLSCACAFATATNRIPLRGCRDHPQPTEQIDLGISVREAARRIGCHPTRIYKLLRSGKLRGYRDGRRLRVIESSIVAYQQGNALPAGESPAVEHRRHAKVSRARFQTALEMLRSHGCR